MAKDGFLKKHRIVRNDIRKDMLYFAIPALLILTVGTGVIIWDLYRNQGNLNIPSVENIAGLVLIVIGGSISLVAAVTLRLHYSSTLVIREDHKLITHGIYRFVRHPIYLGTLLVMIGLPVFVWSLYGTLIMSTLIPVFLIRIRMEEKLLTEEFGDAYRTYRKATRKLIPFIY
ncbi:MAG: isoprenylcysteine carboxylmethyltransferase family protein [Chloroflexota bacterium]